MMIDVTGVNEALQNCVDRVLQSETFRKSPSSRRLLKYLADRSLAGDADQVKEYTIGIDAFGKAQDYDPRQDSTVRIQIGRLRQKLDEYYRKEGENDAMVVVLPKGRFSLACQTRSAEPLDEPVELDAPQPSRGWRVAAFVMGALFLMSLVLAATSLVKLQSEQKARQLASDPWSPELDELWRPFIHTAKPLTIAFGDPLFFQFENKALYRDLSIEKPEDVLKSPNFNAVSKALGSRENRPVHYYAAMGDVSAAFLFGQRLRPHQQNMSLVRSSQLLWQQLAHANVLLLGPPRFFVDKLGNMPVSLEITEGADGFLILHPQQGEPSFFKYREPAGFLTEDGEACVLITHTPGPASNTDVETFASNSTFARVGAVNAFTDPAFAKMLVTKMRDSSGRLPQYFQVLLKVKYKGGVPTETSYLLHRELRPRR